MDLITTHLNADFDGLASMVAARKLYPGAVLAFPGGAQEAVRRFLDLHDLGLARLKDVELDAVTRLILVDTQEPERIGPFKVLCGRPGVPVHVYDHHPDAQDLAPGGVPSGTEFRRVEPVGATTTILIESLREAKLPLTPFEASVLALGLYEETGWFGHVSTTARDLEAGAEVLRAGADLTLVADILRTHVDADHVRLLSELITNSETLYLEGRKVFLATAEARRYRGDFAEVVQQLAEMEGIDAVVAAIAMDDKIEIIGRSRRTEIDVGRMARDFGGGGHGVAASAVVKGATLVEVRERLLGLLTDRYRPTLLARDVMTTPVKQIGEDATVADAEAGMTRYGVNVLPVHDAKGGYVGVMSRETIQKALFHKFNAMRVGQLMQSDAYTAEPETPFREIQARMLERNQRFVPILLQDRVVGAITRTDLLRTLHDDVLASAHARAKGDVPDGFVMRRNLRNMLKDRLPARLFALLERAGELAERSGVSVYVVGGFVRDLLLGRPNLDIDLVVEGDGIAFANAWAGEIGARTKVHDRFGTAVVLLPDGLKLDVATARTEYYEYPTALPTVEQSSIKKDLYRRDFTINTLAVTLTGNRFGELIDYYGGQRDLNDKTIRVLHSLSFIEDPTRVFRAVRFEHRYRFRLSKETLALIKGAVKMNLFDRLSGARLFEELVLLLSEEEARKTVDRLAELGLLRFLHPSLKLTDGLQAVLKAAEETLDWYRLAALKWGGAGRASVESWQVYFIALMRMLPPQALRETLKRLHVPERVADKVRAVAKGLAWSKRILTKKPGPRPSETYRALQGLPDEALLVVMAAVKSERIKREVTAYLDSYRFVRTTVTGDELKAMGLKPGPQYKKILSRLLEARLNREVTTREEEQELARTLAGR